MWFKTFIFCPLSFFFFFLISGICAIGKDEDGTSVQNRRIFTSATLGTIKIVTRDCHIYFYFYFEAFFFFFFFFYLLWPMRVAEPPPSQMEMVSTTPKGYGVVRLPQKLSRHLYIYIYIYIFSFKA
jgi:hypothetical protein